MYGGQQKTWKFVPLPPKTVKLYKVFSGCLFNPSSYRQGIVFILKLVLFMEIFCTFNHYLICKFPINIFIVEVSSVMFFYVTTFPCYYSMCVYVSRNVCVNSISFWFILQHFYLHCIASVHNTIASASVKSCTYNSIKKRWLNSHTCAIYPSFRFSFIHSSFLYLPSDGKNSTLMHLFVLVVKSHVKLKANVSTKLKNCFIVCTSNLCLSHLHHDSSDCFSIRFK